MSAAVPVQQTANAPESVATRQGAASARPDATLAASMFRLLLAEPASGENAMTAPLSTGGPADNDAASLPPWRADLFAALSRQGESLESDMEAGPRIPHASPPREGDDSSSAGPDAAATGAAAAQAPAASSPAVEANSPAPVASPSVVDASLAELGTLLERHCQGLYVGAANGGDARVMLRLNGALQGVAVELVGSVGGLHLRLHVPDRQRWESIADQQAELERQLGAVDGRPLRIEPVFAGERS